MELVAHPLFPKAKSDMLARPRRTLWVKKWWGNKVEKDHRIKLKILYILTRWLEPCQPSTPLYIPPTALH